MRLLGVDFGESRIGLAVSDTEAGLAVPLTTLDRTSDRAAIDAIAALVVSEGVEEIVMGEPLHMDGAAGDRAQRTRSFCSKLHQAIGLPCHLVDERLTSVEARERLAAAGVDIKRHPGRIDAVAAQILLEQYLADSPGDPSD